ncbi:MAG: M18 family aminopeptidase [Lentisphaeria bacterium]|nr:M18 family aminopeptidase [Lentisphaeria bacterium]
MDIIEFLNSSPTQFHSAATIASELVRNGFAELNECDEWALVHGGKYFVQRNNSSVIAFRTGDLCNPKLAVCHTDSPSLKLRLKDASVQDGLLRIPVEVYGGASNPTWLDRPLKVVGRAFFSDADSVLKYHLISSDSPKAVIPNPPIHFVNLNDGLKYNQQNQLAAMLPYSSLQALVDSITPAGFPQQPAESLQAELYLADAQKAILIDGDIPLLQATHLDNLTSCHAVLNALCDCENPRSTIVGGFFDLEEVGLNFQSAGSNFLRCVLERIVLATQKPASLQALHRMLATATALSIDVAHAFHPNFQEKFDKAMSPVIGKGPAIKFHANQRYATTLSGAVMLRELAKKASLMIQDFTPRSDMGCGSTIGPMIAGSLGIQTIDIGVAIWAMHSIRETCASKDVQTLTSLVRAFYAS